MKILVIDYGSGNLRSAAKAVETAARDSAGAVSVTVSADAGDLRDADRIVLPGQGAFGDCMAGLAGLDGMLESLNDAVLNRAVPFLGICVGMQLMAAHGIEHGDHTGLGWFPGTVRRLTPSDPACKIPHMGWNDLVVDKPHPVLGGLPTGSHLYFVHSYAYDAIRDDEVIAHVDYGGFVTAAIGRDNMIGTQFHPDKSQAAGLRLLANFIGWRP